MVSSTVYGMESLLDQVYGLLDGFGYEVWMSHRGTIPVNPSRTALDSCLEAVERCDLFLCLITPRYGSGVLEGELGITHQELLKAIALGKPRWVLAHTHVVFARSLFQKLGCATPEERQKMLARLGYDTPDELKKLRRRQESVMDDFRVIDMYDVAIRHDVAEYRARTGNWVQKYVTESDVLSFVTAQFRRYRDVERFIREPVGKSDPAQDPGGRRLKP
jgi:hypothetical protein